MWRVRNPVENILNADGKWRMLVFDNELSSALFTDGKDYNGIILSEVFNETSRISKNFGCKLFKSLLKSLKFKSLFINAISDIRNIDFEENRVYNYIDGLNSIVEPLMYNHLIRFGPKWVLYDPLEYYQREIGTFKRWLYNRFDSFMRNLAKYFNFKPSKEVSITSNNFLKGSFIVNNGWKLFEEEYKGLYFGENTLYFTAVPSKGIFQYWRVKNCKSAENKEEINFKSNNIILAINPLEGCSAQAYFK